MYPQDRQLAKKSDILAIKFRRSDDSKNSGNLHDSNWQHCDDSDNESDDSWPKWWPASCQNVVSYDQMTTGRVVSYDSVTTTRVVSYDLVTTNRVVSYDPVATTRVISYDPVMTCLSSVKELSDNLDDPTDDKWWPNYFRCDWRDNSCRNYSLKRRLVGLPLALNSMDSIEFNGLHFFT